MTACMKRFVHANIDGEVANRTRTDRVPRTIETRVKGAEPDSWSISVSLELMVELGIIASSHCVMEPPSTIKNGTSSIEINTFCIFLHSLSVDHKRLFLLSIHCFYSNDLNCSKNVCVHRAMLRNVASIERVFVVVLLRKFTSLISHIVLLRITLCASFRRSAASQHYYFSIVK